MLHAGEVSTYDVGIDSASQGEAALIPVQLPPEFKGKDFRVAVAFKDTDVNWAGYSSSGPWLHNIRCRIVSIDQQKALFKVACYVLWGDSSDSNLKFGVLGKFTYIAWV